MKLSRLLLSSMSAGVVAAPAIACFQPPPPVDPPPRVWTEFHAPGDLWVWVEVDDVFPTDMTHACSCGIGLGNTTTPVSPLLQIGDNLTVGVFNTMTQEVVRTIAQFDALASDANSTNGWRNGPGVPSPDIIGSPNEGANWYGFGANVEPVDPGMLGPNEIWIYCFNITWDPAQVTVPAAFPAQYGAGLGVGENDFSPLFDPENEHTSRYSPTFMIPGPAAGAILLVLAPLAARRRR